MSTASSLLSSTTIASMLMPVANLISSIACRRVGSETPTYTRRPRRNSGSTRWRRISFSSTRRAVSRSISIASRSSTGTPNSWQAALAISRGSARFFSTR
jgi:hypothetical protein